MYYAVSTRVYVRVSDLSKMLNVKCIPGMVMGAAGEAPVCDDNLEPDFTGAAADLRRLRRLLLAETANLRRLLRQDGVDRSLIIDGAYTLLLAEAFQQEVMIGHTNEELDQAFSVLRRSRPSSRIIPDDDTDNDNVPDLVSDTDSDDEIPLLVD